MQLQPHDPLRFALNTPLSDAAKVAIVSSLWNFAFGISDPNGDPLKLATYLRYYEEQCREFLHQCTSRRLVVCTKTHRDVVMLVHLLRLANIGAPSTKGEIVAALRTVIPLADPLASDDVLSDAVDFGARLMLMMDIRADRRGNHVINQVPIQWGDCTLRIVIHSQFNTTKELSTPVRLERIFTAASLEHIANIKIVWTDNLADHLRMSEDDTQVAVYSHAQFLKLDQYHDQKFFPVGFVEETLLTLALLLPRGDPQVSQWFKDQQKMKGLHNRVDREAASGRRLKAAERQISKFSYWHDRLVILKQAFDESQPRTLWQWWNDRRNPVQWYNFWIAVGLIVGLTVFFGIGSLIEGGIQVYKAYHPS
ncbi:hypothetical protein BKA64DRAFT_53869 [Cadophora sp. MPI-SDFR-AT-0126]|nr:hypothetical protein BKA64DRAFT_53869 [Leotiomycetes sp. MPI-SDFR-AT-0126]